MHVERRIARRYDTDCLLEVWVPRRGMLGRSKSAELRAADLSIFGASVLVHKADGVGRGQVVQVSINGHKTSAIVRNEFPTDDKKVARCGIEFIKPSDAFLQVVGEIINQARHTDAKTNEELWLRSA